MTTGVSTTIKVSNSPYLRYKVEDHTKVKSNQTPTKLSDSQVNDASESNENPPTVLNNNPIHPTTKFDRANALSQKKYQPLNKKLKNDVAIQTYAHYLKIIRENRFRTRFDLLL